MAPNFLDLATTLENLGTRWLLEKKLISCPVSTGLQTVALGNLLYINSMCLENDTPKCSSIKKRKMHLMGIIAQNF